MRGGGARGVHFGAGWVAAVPRSSCLSWPGTLACCSLPRVKSGAKAAFRRDKASNGLISLAPRCLFQVARFGRADLLLCAFTLEKLLNKQSCIQKIDIFFFFLVRVSY